MRGGIGAFEAGAAEHHVEPVKADIVPDALPQQLDDRLGAIGLEHAGAAELEELQVRLGGDQAARYRIRPGCKSRDWPRATLCRNSR